VATIELEIMLCIPKSNHKRFLAQIKKGDADKVSKLVSKGANVNESDKHGCLWPIHIASTQSNIEVVKKIFLLKNLEDIDVTTGDGFSNTALHLACESGHADIVALLLDEGADPNKYNAADKTPLQIAALSDNSRVDIMKLMIDRGANIHLTNESNETPLHHVTHIDHVQLLLSAGVDIDAQNSNGKTALDLTKNEDVRDLILSEKKKKIEESTNKAFKPGYSSLHLTSEQGDTIKVKNILQTGADVNARTDTYCNTALHLASSYGRVAIVELLLDNHADINAENKNGETPLHSIARSENTKLHEDIVQLLIKRGANVNLKTEWKRKPLHYAAQMGYKEVVRLLLDAGAVDAKDYKGRRALDYSKDPEIDEILLSEHKKRKKIDKKIKIDNSSDSSDTRSTHDTSFDTCSSDNTDSTFQTEYKSSK
jgi:ankyrin repeat protein